MNLKSLCDESLLNQTKLLVENERKITADVIKHFFELNRRKLYLARGYDSLFSMLTKEFRYCPATAMLRINAVRLMVDVPEVIEKIESVEMLVTIIANIQSFLNSEAKIQRAYTKEAKIELIETCLGKSVIEVQKEFVRRNPEIEKRESVRIISENRLRVSHSVSNALEEKLQRIKMLWTHVDPNMSREDLLDRMAEITLDQIDPVRKTARAKKRAEKAEQSKTEHAPVGSAAPIIADNSLRVPEVKVETIDSSVPTPDDSGMVRNRQISAETNRLVYERNDGDGCAFEDETTKKRCGSHFQLQRDHIEPWSHGGSNDSDNLRIFCANHNRWSWRTRSVSQVKADRLAYV